MSPNVLYDRLCGKGRYGDALGQRNKKRGHHDERDRNNENPE